MQRSIWNILIITVFIGGMLGMANKPIDSNDEVSQIPENASVATFAGGCFWCMEPPFEKEEGVYAVLSGYSGGTEENPSYDDVSSGSTGHTESIQIFYDKTKISYEKLLDIFWKNIDPTQLDGQFVDRGTQYRSAIFYHDEAQKAAAEKSKQELNQKGVFKAPLVTEITKAGPFYLAEDYHQDYYKKNPVRYKFYRYGSGRDQFLDRVWGDNR